ncbi:MAG: abhydrolase domain-containing 18 [Actinobacteria bacterium]|nr:abhydrolase domain-containing 18 [Actinomycetota bacterium]
MYNLYSYEKKENFNCEIKKETEKGTYQKILISFESPFKTNIKINDLAYSEVFISKDKKTAPGDNLSNTLLVLLHGFASKKNRLNNYYAFIKNMLNNGLDCAFIHLPYHLSRTPAGQLSGQKLIYTDDKETLEFFHQSVVDVKRFIDIAIKNIGYEKIVLCGFSLGSMISVITAAIDNRINKTILIFGGGNWHQIHWNSSLSYVLKGNCLQDDIINRVKCRFLYKDFPVFCGELEKTDLDSLIRTGLCSHFALKEKTIKQCFLCDPAAFAYRLKPGNTLMLNCRFDHFFSKQSTLELWKNLGKPKIYWFNKLHSSRILANRKVLKIISNFIKDKPGYNET